MLTIPSDRLFNGRIIFDGPVEFREGVSDQLGLKAPYDAVFTVGVEAATVINIAAQLRDADGNNIDYRTMVHGWVSEDTIGDIIATTAPDTLAIGTDGTMFPSGGDSVVFFHALSEADGNIDIDCTQDAAEDYYLNLLIGGKVWTSGIISHAGP